MISIKFNKFIKKKHQIYLNIIFLKGKENFIDKGQNVPVVP